MESTLVESKPQSELRALGGRVLLAGLIALYFAVGFQIVGMFARKGQLHTLRTSLDDAIPFVPLTIYLYAWVYTSAFYPVFVRDTLQRLKDGRKPIAGLADTAAAVALVEAAYAMSPLA